MLRKASAIELGTPLRIADLSASPGKRLAARPALRRRLILFVLLALAIAGGEAFFLSSFWAPAPGRPGIDENAYLVAGKNIAMTGWPGMRVTDDFQFVDAMWVGTETKTFAPPKWFPSPLARILTAHTQAGWFYPKYPIGLPMLDALTIKLAARATGGTASDFSARKAAFAVSPVCMTLAALGVGALGMTVTQSPFFSLLAMIVLITTPTALQLSELPNSHAPALCAVVWGIVLLMRFYRRGSVWAGAGAGLLLGFAVTCRYSEALLLFPLYPLDQILAGTAIKTAHPFVWQLIMACRILPVGPVGIASLLTIRWRRPASYFRASVPLIAWALPVGGLLAFNWFSMGHLTGYDTTHESGGFTLDEFLRKWDFSVQHIYLYGLFLFAPLGVAGLGMMFRRQWREALILTTWFLPGALVYTAYYWGAQAPGVGYLRFLLTLFPPLIVGAMWLLKSAGSGWDGDAFGASDSSGFAEPLLAGLLVAAAACVGLAGSLHVMIVQHLGNLNLALSAENANAVINGPTGRAQPSSIPPIIFADEGLFPQFLQYAQFMIDGTWYGADAFEPRAFGGFGFLGLIQRDSSATSPSLIQQQRIDHLTKADRGQTAATLAAREIALISTALDHGQPVFAILTAEQHSAMDRTLAVGKLQLLQRARWAEPFSIPLELPDDPSPADAVSQIPKESLLVPPFDSGVGLFRWAPEALTVYQVLR